jgi:hypothetical protein
MPLVVTFKILSHASAHRCVGRHGPDLRSSTLGEIPASRRRYVQLTRSYTRYVEAPNWERLRLVALNSTDASGLDEMIQLVEHTRWASRPASTRLAGVRNIVFRKVSDLPKLLGLVPVTSTTKPPAVPTPGDAGRRARTVGGERSLTGRHLEDHGTPVLADPADEDLGRKDWVAAPGEIAAARIIQRAVRLATTRKSGRPSSGPPAARQSLYAEYRTNVKVAGSNGKSTYSKIFLGAMPHAMLVANRVRQWVQEEKDAAKKALRIAVPQSIEEIRMRQTYSAYTLLHFLRAAC